MTSSDSLLNDLKLSIIKILYKNPHTPFNYEMMWAYLKLTEDFLEIMGAMQSLEKNGFIYPSIENKKYYYLSDDGKRYLQRLKKDKKRQAETNLGFHYRFCRFGCRCFSFDTLSCWFLKGLRNQASQKHHYHQKIQSSYPKQNLLEIFHNFKYYLLNIVIIHCFTSSLLSKE